MHDSGLNARNYACLVLVFCLTAATALDYANPLILKKDLPDPGSIPCVLRELSAGLLFWDGTYYVANTQSDDSSPTKCEIHTSVDLKSWKLAGSIFKAVDLIIDALTYAGYETCLGSVKFLGTRYSAIYCSKVYLEIHYIGPHFVAYFAARFSCIVE